MSTRNMPCPVSVSEESLNEFQASQVAVSTSAAPLDVAPPTGTGFKARKWVKIKALGANTVSVYIGNAGVSITTGFELPPGQELELKVYDPTTIFVVASAAAKVSWIAI